MSLVEFYREYEKYNKAEKYIIGFIYKHNVYYAIVDSCEYGIKMSRTSSHRGAIPNLRFQPTNADKVAMLENATLLMSDTEFFAECEKSIYNKGEIFEKLITEKFGQVWQKDNLPFYMGGDLVANQTVYQIKFQNATFCTLTQIEKLRVA